MQMRPEIQIQSILKAMADVIVPALAPDNKLAQEQAGLCMGLLGLMARQLPLQYRFDCDELARLRTMSGRLLSLAGPRGVEPRTREALEAGVRDAGDVLARARAEPAEVTAAVRRLREASATLVSEALAGGDAAATAGLERVVLDGSREQLLRDRAWLVSQGWEADAAALPAIETLIAPV